MRGALGGATVLWAIRLYAELLGADAFLSTQPRDRNVERHSAASAVR